MECCYGSREGSMKIIAIAAVSAGGKTTVVNAIEQKLPKVKTLHFDDYSFEGEVEDFYAWTIQGADYNVWNLAPLIEDVREIAEKGELDYLVLDYPFAYCHEGLREYIDCAIFIDTPLDIAMARHILRDMKEATGEEIRNDLKTYLKYARVAYVQMLKDVLPSSDYVIDGAKELVEIVDEVLGIIS